MSDADQIKVGRPLGAPGHRRPGGDVHRVIRPPIVEVDCVRILLQGGLQTIVDLVDADLAAVNWSANRGRSGGPYAARLCARDGGKRRIEKLHRVVAARMGILAHGRHVDHMDGNTLNNRRANLRAATHSENLFNMKHPALNTSGVRGVYWSTRRRRWVAEFKKENKRIYVGCFKSIEEAASAWAAAVKFHRGPNAVPRYTLPRR